MKQLVLIAAPLHGKAGLDAAICLKEEDVYKRQQGDCPGAFLVLAMTDSRAVNHAVWEEAKKAGAFVNAADCKEECDFYFPGIAAGGGIVAGITAEGENHRLAKEVTGQFRELLRERNHREGNG